jgi:hypothetical protein
MLRLCPESGDWAGYVAGVPVGVAVGEGEGVGDGVGVAPLPVTSKNSPAAQPGPNSSFSTWNQV